MKQLPLNQAKQALPRFFTSPASTAESVEKLTSRIKAYEQAFEHVLPGTRPFVVRLDGVSFKRFTSRLVKPFDPHFTEAMIRTTKDLMSRSAAATGFCQSDEITLISSPSPDGDSANLLYGGRVSKICSVLASLASARFNYHLHSLSGKEVPEPGIFDARVFSVPDWKACADVLRWRHQFDCRRNALHSIAQAHYPAAELQGKPIRSVIDRLLQEKGVDAFTDYPHANVYGSFVKKVVVQVDGYNPKSKETVSAFRNRLEARSFDWKDDDEAAQASFVQDPFFEQNKATP